MPDRLTAGYTLGHGGNMKRLAVLILAVAVLGLWPATAHAQRYFGAFTGYSYGGAAGECPSLRDDCPNRRTGYGVVFGGLGGGFGFERESPGRPISSARTVRSRAATS